MPRYGRWSRANRIWVLVICTVALLLVGSGVALAVHADTKKAAAPGPTTTLASPTTAALPTVTCPLTGAPAPGGSVPARPAMAVKVDNYPEGRPWSGVDQADIVFEEPVEGHITRLVAVFQCQTPPLVGDVRSARAPDVPTADLLSRPLLVHAGGIAPVLSLLRSADLVDVNLLSDGSLVVRKTGRYAPYNTYIVPAAVWAQNPAATTPPAPVFTYSPAPVGATPAASVHIPFSSSSDVTWTWNPAKEAWALSYSGVPATVSSGAPVDTANVVVMTVAVTNGPWMENSEGGLEVQARMTGSGPVVVLRNGQQISGTWSRPSLGASMLLTAASGATIALQPGPTWVEIVPSYVNVTVAP